MSKNSSGSSLEVLLNAFIVWPIKLLMFMMGIAVIMVIGILALAPLSSWGRDMKVWGSKVFGRKA